MHLLLYHRSQEAFETFAVVEIEDEFLELFQMGFTTQPIVIGKTWKVLHISEETLRKIKEKFHLDLRLYEGELFLRVLPTLSRQTITV